jgi:hypothetical protein
MLCRFNPAPGGWHRQAQPAACRPQRSGSPAKGCWARRGAPPRTDPARIVNARTLDVYAGRMANVRNDGTRDPGAAPHDLASLAAHWYTKARERAASTGAPPKLVADIAELGELTAARAASHCLAQRQGRTQTASGSSAPSRP